MEYVQEHITTLHDFGTGIPNAPTDRAAVVVPMTDREYRKPAAESVLSTLVDIDPARVIIALRADARWAGAFEEWLSEFDLIVEILWCSGPRLRALLEEQGLGGEAGKGRDVWLALGVAADIEDAEFVVVHDADANTSSPVHLHRLLAPLASDTAGGEYEFVKGYYARIEQNRLFGRLFRLFYAPLLRTLQERHDAEILAYLGAFRYALAGEFALTGDIARRVCISRGWGLELDILGAAFERVGVSGTAQVDLGTHVHDHRGVDGSDGLSAMSHEVGAALFQVIETQDVSPEYETLPTHYERVATKLIEQYAADAAHNGLEYDLAAERAQVERYADAIVPPGPDMRLPAWSDAPLTPRAVRRVVREDLAAAGKG